MRDKQHSKSISNLRRTVKKNQAPCRPRHIAFLGLNGAGILDFGLWRVLIDLAGAVLRVSDRVFKVSWRMSRNVTTVPVRVHPTLPVNCQVPVVGVDIERSAAYESRSPHGDRNLPSWTAPTQRLPWPISSPIPPLYLRNPASGMFNLNTFSLLTALSSRPSKPLFPPASGSSVSCTANAHLSTPASCLTAASSRPLAVALFHDLGVSYKCLLNLWSSPSDIQRISRATILWS